MVYNEIVRSLLFTKKLICDKMKDGDGDFNQNNFKEVIIETVLDFNKVINLPPELIENKEFILWPFRVVF